ncbi:helix-turn-helix transcriptional regulator [Georgenia wutianyii]|uniref:Helix-turn-helix transcriptional regulator n=2 Tax=Georgenia wutianyii TaxID=2585135 RepID=A0ABX5VR25_9MICO|nr:helix-turn-helix transcriptional regulator [Georgenia wutianyii]
MEEMVASTTRLSAVPSSAAALAGAVTSVSAMDGTSAARAMRRVAVLRWCICLPPAVRNCRGSRTLRRWRYGNVTSSLRTPPRRAGPQSDALHPGPQGRGSVPTPRRARVHGHRMATVPFHEQVGLVLRATRRELGMSQRAFAEAAGVPKSTLARVERSALGCSLELVLDLLGRTGHSLGVVGADGELVTRWTPTDLRARDRSDRRFPAHREVREVPRMANAPLWWVLHEFLGTGRCGPQPRWTAEGFAIPPGTRFGREPRPREPGEGLRWPY